MSAPTELDRAPQARPAEAAAAAQSCLAAQLPRSDPDRVRAGARRCLGYATELDDAHNSLTGIAANPDWSGSAAEQFRTRLQSSAPNLAATQRRYRDYAQALLSYAQLIEGLLPQLVVARRVVTEQVAALAMAADEAATLNPGVAGFGLPLPPTPDQLARRQQVQNRATELSDAVARFVEPYNAWVVALKTCSAAISRADAADPTRDLHGWALWEHRLLQPIVRYADSVTTFLLHGGWANASNALSFLASNLTVIGLGLLIIFPPAALYCFAAVAVLSAIQLGVDAWRKWHQHEQVSAATLAFDALGAVPVPGAISEGRQVYRAGRSGWSAASGIAKPMSAAARGASETRDAAIRVVRDPREMMATGFRDIPNDHYRSLAYGGASQLAARWTAPLLWDGSNAVAALPNINGAGSTPQYLWNHRSFWNHPSQQSPRPGQARLGQSAKLPPTVVRAAGEFVAQLDAEIAEISRP